jgi:glycine/D-amino acid oxidase-like deaminating enzyme
LLATIGPFARWCLPGNRQMSNNEISDAYDVIVVGGGAAGLSSALVLAQSRRSVLVIDSGEPPNAAAAAMHHFLSRDGMNPLALLEVAGLRSAAMVAR